MVKEFEKLVKKMDVNINLQSHEKGVHCRIVFIPLKADMPLNLKPVETFGTIDEIENWIRFQLDGKCPAPTIKEKIVEKTGVPKDNIIIAKPKPIVVTTPSPREEVQEFLAEKEKPPVVVEVDDLKENVQEVVLKENVVRCSKCELPIKDDMSQCIYGDECPQKNTGPNTKPLTPEENKLRNAMVKEEVKAESSSYSLFGSPAPAVSIPKPAQPVSNIVNPNTPVKNLNPSDVPEWAQSIQDEYNQALNTPEDDNLI